MSVKKIIIATSLVLMTSFNVQAKPVQVSPSALYAVEVVTNAAKELCKHTVEESFESEFYQSTSTFIDEGLTTDEKWKSAGAKIEDSVYHLTNTYGGSKEDHTKCVTEVSAVFLNALGLNAA